MYSSVPQILIPFDFSEQSLITLDQSYNLAKFYDAEISLLYVIDEGDKTYEPTEEDAIKKQMEAKLEELAATVSKKHNIKVNPIIIKGHIADEILEVAANMKPKMIMMGTMGSLGSNTLKVVEAAKCPVITIKGKNMRQGCKNIVIPIDLTKESTEKVKYAIELGKRYGAAIRVVSVLFSKDKTEVKRITKQMEQAVFLINSEVKCTSEMINAIDGESLAQIVINYAKKVDADLIMIMTQQEQESKIIPMSSNSDAHFIIVNSDIPVMSIVPSIKMHEVQK